MKDKIKIFKNPEFGQVRVIVQENGEPLFVGVDVASILGYKEPHKTIVRHVEDVDRMKHPIPNKEGFHRYVWAINKNGLHTLMFSSRISNIKSFKKWIFEDVVSVINKTQTELVKPMTQAELVALQAQAMLELEQKQREHELRLIAIENKISYLVTIQEEINKRISELQGCDEIIKFSPRQELNYLVRFYAKSAGVRLNKVWNKIYSELYCRYGISINVYKKEKGENNLDIAEKIDVIEKLKAIVSILIKEIGRIRPLVKK